MIGLTYDVIRDYNSEVVLGNAAATVASIVGNANGQAVAGGFDTSAIESQLDSLQNKMGDFLVNGSSIVTNGVGVLNLLPGDNITISRDGRTLTISGEGGGSNIYYGTTAPAASLGVDRDAYFRLDYGLDGVFEDISPQNHITITNSYLDNNGFNADISGYPVSRNNCYSDSIAIKINGLESGKQYTVSCDLAISNTAEIMPVPPYSYNYIHIGNQTTLDNDDNHGFRPTYAIQQVEGYGGHYEFTFTADDEQNIHIGFDFLDLKDNVNFTATIRNLRVNIAKVTAIYCKVGNTWEKYEGGETYTAGSNIDITNNVISAPVMTGATADANGASGTVPQPLIADKDKVLKGDGTWGTAGADVSITPSLQSGSKVAEYEINGVAGVLYSLTNTTGDYYNPIIYSETEREVGVWVNNKPLYQKSINIGVLTKDSSFHYVPHNIANIDEIVDVNGVYQRDDGSSYRLNLMRPTTTNAIMLGADATNIQYMNTQQDPSRYKATWVTLYYTKTTDTAGSGSYNTLGVPTVHYSTSEQVIGMWTDGKPLYSKMVSGTTSSDTSTTAFIADIGANAVIRFFKGLIDGKDDLNAYRGTDSWAQTWVANDGHRLANRATGNDYASKSCYVEVHYTKTTD